MLAASVLLTGCETAVSSAGCASQLVQYSRDRDARLADEIDAAPAGAEWPSRIVDLGALRAFCRGR